jgi:hypothetical protein
MPFPARRLRCKRIKREMADWQTPVAFIDLVISVNVYERQ